MAEDNIDTSIHVIHDKIESESKSMINMFSMIKYTLVLCIIIIFTYGIGLLETRLSGDKKWDFSLAAIYGLITTIILTMCIVIFWVIYPLLKTLYSKVISHVRRV